MNATLDIDLPQSVHLTENELKMVLAAKLFEMGELSSGQAAKLVGIPRREFLSPQVSTACPYFNMTRLSWKRIWNVSENEDSNCRC